MNIGKKYVGEKAELVGLIKRLQDDRLMNPDFPTRIEAARVIARLVKNVQSRDEFIIKKGLFQEYMDSLPKTPRWS